MNGLDVRPRFDLPFEEFILGSASVDVEYRVKGDGRHAATETLNVVVVPRASRAITGDAWHFDFTIDEGKRVRITAGLCDHYFSILVEKPTFKRQKH